MEACGGAWKITGTSGRCMWTCQADAQKLFLLTPKLSRNCNSDAENLCKELLLFAKNKDFSSRGGVINCLIDKRTDIKDASCRADILRKQQQRAADIKTSPEAYEVCEEDIGKFCRGVRSGGLGQVHKCLQNHITNISSSCRRAELSN